MLFEEIGLCNVRVFNQADIVAKPGMNLIYGRNGTGKTSFLEAISLLSRARSFRTKKINDVIKKGQQHFIVTAKIINEELQSISSGIERKQTETHIRFAGEEVKKVSDQARNLPVLVLTPESQGLLNETPKERRRWLDWLMFHVEPAYLENWSKYQKSLRQRNQLLRENSRDVEFRPWEESMSNTAETIYQYCRGAVEEIEQRLTEELDYLLSGQSELQYTRGWKEEESLCESLQRNRESDRQTGYTRCGSHRSDLRFSYDGNEAGKTLSRGQAKLYMVALLLAQAAIISDKSQKRPVLLIDDVFAELDKPAQKRLSQRLSELDVQCFVTSTEREMQGYCSALFHVEHGTIENQI